MMPPSCLMTARQDGPHPDTLEPNNTMQSDHQGRRFLEGSVISACGVATGTATTRCVVAPDRGRSDVKGDWIGR